MSEGERRDPRRRTLRPPTADFPATQPWKWLHRWIVHPILSAAAFVLSGF
jgi:hypothetical protein